MKVHHIGYAVRDIDKALKGFSDLGYTVGEKLKDESRKIVIAFVRNEDTVVELITPVDAGSPVESVLEKNGPTAYHICYEVENIVDSCKELKKKGWIVLIKPAPAPAIDGALVAFLYNQNIGLIELVEITSNKEEL